ncbi:MAG TPA: glycosyltransferase [Prolixibacteraceae bacterium]
MIHKVAIMLPHYYKGGTLRAAKNIAKQIAVGARLSGDEVGVVFSYVGGDHYDKNEDFLDLLDNNIEVRETFWNQVPKEDCVYLSRLLRFPVSQYGSPYYSIPNDGANDFYDCDFWIIISDRLSAPVLPLRKYIIVTYDYIQRYVPEIFSETLWNLQTNSFFPIVKNAEAVFVTTPSTMDDLISYAGVPKNRVVLFENSFDELQVGEIKENADIRRISDDYFVWTTNTTNHKNHIRALKALEKYYSYYNGTLKIVITGGNTKYFDPSFQGTDKFLMNHPYIKSISNLIENSRILQEKMTILGELSDLEYMQTVQEAKFIWHPNLYDNGTFSVIEAGYLGIPALSSKYPAMEFIENAYKLNMRFFDPYNISIMAKALKEMEISYKYVILPSKEDLLSHTWYKNAHQTYLLFKEFF